MTRTVTITFDPIIRLTPRKGEELVIDLTDVPESVIAHNLVTGTRIKVTNAYNSGGADTPHADRRSQVERLVAAWKRGEANAGSTGPRDSIVGDMREAFVTRQVANGKSTKDADAMIKNAVAQAFGDGEKATFPRFLDAVATLKVASVPDAKRQAAYDKVRGELEASAIEAAGKLRAERAKATEALNFDTADLF